MKKSSAHSTLLLAPEIFATDGGIARALQLYLKVLCERAAEHEETVRLVALNDAVLDSRDLRRYGNSKVDDWLVCNRDKRRFIRGALRLSRNCRLIVCGHVAQLPVAWAAKQIRRGLRYALVAHGIEVWRRFTLPERIALRGAERIFCVSDFTRRRLLEHCPLPPARLVVVPNALHPNFEIAAGRPLATCPPTILTVARLSRQDAYKGIDHLIAAMPAIRAAVPGATLRIVGRGDDLPRLQSLAEKYHVNDGTVAFLGFIEDAGLSAELSHCRLFALPSGGEGFGLVFLEAMAHGRPCVGASAGGIPEVITPKSGILTPYGDVPALAATGITALQTDWDEEAVLARARAFSYSRFKTQLDSLFDEFKHD